MSKFNSNSEGFLSSFKIAIVVLIVLWGIHIFQWTFNVHFYAYGGVFPRTVDGLRGIALSPLLHGSFMHLISNSAPLLVLLMIILFFYRKVAVSSILLIYFLSGLAVWIFARPVYHIGASGVIYGLVAFVFWCGIFLRKIRSIVLSLIVALLYSGMFLGVLPNQDGISWESHLLGGIIGIFVAYLMKEKLKKLEPVEDRPQWEEETPKYFLDRDVFDKKKDDYWR